ncbi:hypothetical protein [Alteripontixanthobacter muriae]|uniref:hypothetical protein n=1 Tax=Alteripontixanthobacter muriae TaxID=2705546 RepID=UPI001E5265A8|nr:hypothetical protein [Alteripontixanthobacter muriae]
MLEFSENASDRIVIAVEELAEGVAFPAIAPGGYVGYGAADAQYEDHCCAHSAQSLWSVDCLIDDGTVDQFANFLDGQEFRNPSIMARARPETSVIR